MTDYNDGEWHGWNGGECPVHPDSVVDVVPNRGMRTSMDAKDAAWSAPSHIIVFRVTKQHKEPREFWLCHYGDRKIDVLNRPPSVSGDFYHKVIHVREVTE